jgi:2-methylisocitrate lyase-like PEP mutase family enzyme
MNDNQNQRAIRFLKMHTQDSILVLPNAWDVASARVLQSCGATAIGTTSMGIAAAAGYPDEEIISLEEMVTATRRIVNCVQVPVTMDLEAGYGTTPEIVANSARQAIDCGAVGINFEDGTGNPEDPLAPTRHMVDSIAAIRAMANDAGIPLVINARTDVFLAEVGTEESRLEAALDRGHAYRDAGADCVFVPGGLSHDTIRALAQQMGCPINVVANPAISIPVVATVGELQDLGVARVSIGSGAMRAVLAFVQRIGRELMTTGTYDAMAAILSEPDSGRAYDAAIGL